MVKIKSRTPPAALALLGVCVLTAGTAAAADQPDDIYSNSLRLGLYSVFYHTSANDLSGPFVPPGANIHTDNVETLYAGYVRRLSSSFDLELALGWPPLTKTEGRGPAKLGSVPYDGQIISTARWLSPTLLLNYKFLSEDSKIRPYIGVGVNYTDFYDRTSTAQGNAASGGPTKLSLSSSVGPAGTVGLSWNLTQHWNFYTSYSVSQVKTRLSADTAGVIRTTHISFGPQAWVISGGYSF